MTALDYLRGKDRNVNLGSEDPSRKWNSFVTITLADGSEYPHKGLVDFADPQVDPKTGTFSVRAEMPNPDRGLRRRGDKSESASGCARTGGAGSDKGSGA